MNVSGDFPFQGLAPLSRLLYYNASTGAGAVGALDASDNHITLHTFPNGAFATGWSQAERTTGSL